MKQIIAGIHPIRTALENDITIDRAYIKDTRLNEELKGLLYHLRDLKVPIFRVPNAKLDRFHRGVHQGIVAFQTLIAYASLDFVLSQTYQKGQIPALVVLDSITDIRNIGAIARTAEHAGVNALVLESKGNAIINDIALKASAGALNLLPICRVSNLITTLDYIKRSGLTIIGTDSESQTELYQQNFTKPYALMIGSEGTGLKPELKERCDTVVAIPRKGKIESLNVSVAAGVVMFEALRQRMG